MQRWLHPFQVQGRIARPIVVVFALVNVLVLLNALLHDPRIGYDAEGYLAYVEVLSQGRLPTPAETYQYLSPPLPFVLPAAVRALTRGLGLEDSVGRMLAWKCGQLGNVGWSLLLTFFLLRLGRLAETDSIAIRLASLSFLGILPVLYQAFAGVRAEPVLAALTVAATYFAVAALGQREPSPRRFVALGCVVGLLALTRQWALSVAAALGAMGLLHLACHGEQWRRLLGLGGASAAVALVIGGGFYFHLFDRYGSLSPHQQVARFPDARRAQFSFRNQPASFYLDLRPEQLFSDPVFPNLPNRLFPILHSTLWGDYWGYWVVSTRDVRDGSYLNYPKARQLVRRSPPQAYWLRTNRDAMGAYLGRLNAAALFPTAIMVVALGFGVWRAVRSPWRRERPEEADLCRFSVAIIFFSLGAYYYFLMVTPDPFAGTPIKAMYQLHILPLWCLLVALTLARLRARSTWLHRAVVVGLGAFLLYEAPILFTRFPQVP